MQDGNERTLKKSLTITQAIGLGITIVVGSGLLLLPGIAYQMSGGASIYVWLICALFVIPLLVIFSSLGARYPTAGGIAGFMQNAFSRHWGAATEIMLLGTFGLGIPAITLTGSYYLDILLPDGIRSEYSTFILSILIVVATFAVNYLGASVSGNVQKYFACILVCILVLVPALSLGLVDDYGGEHITPIGDTDFSALFPLIGLVFFAYTGWEMLSFTIEEYKNPARDYPISVAASFLIVICLYILLVYAIQAIVPIDDPLLGTAPLSALTGQVFGEISGQLIAIISFVIIFANLVGAVWAASRLVFSSSREGLLPASISKLNDSKTPIYAITVTCCGFIIILTLNFYDLLKINDLLRLAGQNFFILYGMSVAAYIKISKTAAKKWFGWASLSIVVLTMGTFGAELLYPVVLLSLGYFISKYFRQAAPHR